MMGADAGLKVTSHGSVAPAWQGASRQGRGGSAPSVWPRPGPDLLCSTSDAPERLQGSGAHD